MNTLESINSTLFQELEVSEAAMTVGGGCALATRSHFTNIGLTEADGGIREDHRIDS